MRMCGSGRVTNVLQSARGGGHQRPILGAGLASVGRCDWGQYEYPLTGARHTKLSNSVRQISVRLFAHDHDVVPR